MAYHHHLMVVSPFAKYVRGSMIHAEDKIKEVLAGPHAHSVIKFYPHPIHVDGLWGKHPAPVEVEHHVDPDHTRIP